jgi:hypothetical protein
MIDTRHRLRPERIINGRASLFQDIKQQFRNLWRGIVYVFSCLHFRNKNKHGYEPIDTHEEDEQQHRPLLNN